MSLPHTILGFLRGSPMTGYDLKRRFDDTVSHFWPADRAQIYRTLARLESEGWVEVKVVPQAGKPDQKVHHLTPSGRDELHGWLTTRLPSPQVREATLIQIFFGDELSDPEAMGLLEGQRDALHGELVRLEEIAASLEPDPPRSRAAGRERFFRRLTLDHGIAMLRAEIAWLEASLARLENRIEEAWRP